MRAAAVIALIALALPAAAQKKSEGKPAWLGEEMPLPLAVKTPADLEFKTVAERQYLIFNLLASGKVAWDAGDYAEAAKKFERLLAVPQLDPDVVRVVKPLLEAARARAAGTGGSAAAAEPVIAPAAPPEPPKPKRPEHVTVTGTVSGGGEQGPGGAVVWLKRADGKTPQPAPVRIDVQQKDKSFVPLVAAVPVGSTVAFTNTDPVLHNVFSLSKPNDFDTGLYKAPGTKDVTLTSAGPVQLLCNIHTSMIGWLYVVDTPYYAVADGSGRFSIAKVPPGEYVAEAWHPASSQLATRKLTLGETAEARLALTVGADKGRPAFVPDKYGKPRQSQLGY